MAFSFALTFSSTPSIYSSISLTSASSSAAFTAWATLSSQDIPYFKKYSNAELTFKALLGIQIKIFNMQKILVTGPFGQVGTELVEELQKLHGKGNVVALGHKHIPATYDGALEKADVTDVAALRLIFQKHNFTQVYHLAAVLSVTGEQKPDVAWSVNLQSLKTILDLSRQMKVRKVFWASSMAVFGPNTPKESTPQHTIIEPSTMYGITKYAGELLGQYYFSKYGLDVRSLRYPGIISWKEMPGGGTTDYAIDIFYGALQKGSYTCFVRQDTSLPMIYMDDVIRGTLQLMEVQSEQVKVRTSYNMASLTFTAGQLAEAINKRVPLKVDYQPDQRQKIADSWPDSIDDSEARKDWGWSPKVTLEELVDIMLTNIKAKIEAEKK